MGNHWQRKTAPSGLLSLYMSHWALLLNWKPDPHSYSFSAFVAKNRNCLRLYTKWSFGFTLLSTLLLLLCVPLKLVVILEKSKLTSPLGSLYSEYICSGTWYITIKQSSISFRHRQPWMCTSASEAAPSKLVYTNICSVMVGFHIVQLCICWGRYLWDIDYCQQYCCCNQADNSCDCIVDSWLFLKQ